ncbi:structure-specific endonuclease subunit slx1 [Asbolus verrucosus]|uniref:Structure-specific endonuclease subunit SLX1 homolog n=1 Tax=Asbolus verrucosus TaxID=1661398 RepID=A0A482VL50_ASBVE|nr:structure-specific endonuclease subunit slx1 [Asbolus verrucosus]
MEQEADVIEHFYGVYLLYCTNPKYTGRVYIGYTVDPNRRIKQHNKGKHAGGAWKTSNRGPWVMVMIVHGFPNDISALRFEWAWQHPHTSRRLHHVAKKKPREKVYDFTLRVLSEMLLVGPWRRLPLTIRWLNDDFVRDLAKTPPMHMPICYGPVISKKLPATSEPSDEKATVFCYFCKGGVEKGMKCLSPDCDVVSHVICLSKCFVKKGEYVPIEGDCPSCNKTYLWGDLVRKYKGCYNNADVLVRADAGDDFYGSDSD